MRMPGRSLRCVPEPQARGRLTSRMRISTPILLGVVIASGAREVRAAETELVRAMPEDVMAACFLAGRGDVSPPGGARSTLALAGFLVDRASETGLLANVDSTIRGWLDALAAVSTVLDYPHAVALFDFDATARADGGHELAGLRGALIIRAADRAKDKIERRIQHLLNVFTNAEHGEISRQTDEGRVVFSLRDRRLPNWAVIEWGAIGDYYVVALGDDSIRRVAQSVNNTGRSLAADRWFLRAFGEAGGGAASVAAYVRFDRLRQRGDASLARKVVQVQESLGLAGVGRGLWTFGYQGRAVEANGFVLGVGRDELMPIAGSRFLEGIAGSVIPGSASRFAVIDCSCAALFRRLRNAYLASRSPAARESTREFWQGIEADAGVAIEQDIFSHLTRPTVIHDDPRHLLRLPIMRTVLLRIDGDARLLRGRIDKLLTYVQEEYGDACRWPLHRDADGVWYSHLGLITPALMVTDQWVVISHSPAAVRRNVEFLSREPNAE